MKIRFNNREGGSLIPVEWDLAKHGCLYRLYEWDHVVVLKLSNDSGLEIHSNGKMYHLARSTLISHQWIPVNHIKTITLSFVE